MGKSCGLIGTENVRLRDFFLKREKPFRIRQRNRHLPQPKLNVRFSDISTKSGQSAYDHLAVIRTLRLQDKCGKLIV